ncbi:MAG: glycosyltransferase family 4 protein [Nitrospira sp.]|nr:glycosyltransferase family 4 protein [Nitrospira sp.]MDH5192047.1 glycosyltransferase family 4 protein [Nitrospira sp.]
MVFINRFFYPDQSATSQLLTDLAFHFAEKSHPVTVITSRQLYGDARSLLPPQEELRGVKICRVWSTRFGRAKLLGRALDYATFYLGVVAALFKMVRAGDIVIAKTDPPLISVVAAAITTLSGARLINWTQDLFPEIAGAIDITGTRILEPGLRWLRNRALKMAACNIVIGEHMAGRLRGEGVPASTIRVIHNWADSVAVRPIAHHDNPLRIDWNLQDKFVVGYSGNLGRAHEFQTILQAAEQLCDSPTIRFLFIGAGVGLLPLQQEVNRRALSNVLFQPYQPREQLSYSLSVADLHLVSLRPALEGLIVPSKFYGIAAAGRPVLFLGSPTGEIAGILGEHHCGYTVGVGEVDQTVTIISRLASDEGECRRLGQAARMALEQHYDKKAAFRDWDETLAPWLNAA